MSTARLRAQRVADGFAPYVWAASVDDVAERHGIRPEAILKFDQNTPPLPGVPQVPLARSMARLERWELDPRRRAASITVIDDTPNEFPRHRGSLTARPYRYGYCASPSVNPTQGWPTLKHDLQTGQRAVFDHGPGRAAGEPVFIGRPGGTEEDDGWLVTYVHDLAAGTAEFAVLDAQDFDRGYVARVPLPQRVPFGFHGNWVSDRAVAPPA